MISHFKNRHLGQTCIIIGNGPSLSNVPYSFLNSYNSFGQNKIYMLEGFQPDYYVAINRLLIEQNYKRINDLTGDKFIPQGMLLNGHELPLVRHKKEFSKHPDIWIYEGYTVTFVSLQLAYYMGFSTVLLVGVDHYYQYEGKPNKVSVMANDDPNHFHPDYFKGQLWNNPDLENSEVSYRMAKMVYEESNRRIVNLTANTRLDVFEKDSIDNWK